MDDWLRRHLACPRDSAPLHLKDGRLTCAAGHSYPVVDGCPILLVDDAEPTHGYMAATLAAVGAMARQGGATATADTIAADGRVDDFVQDEIVRSCGNLYATLKGRLPRYPIPEFRLPAGAGSRLLDIGCNWGRWSVAAGRKGYRVVGLDPSLDAVMAARRVTRQLGIDAQFVVGDARFLPFADDTFDVVFSYSVFQHFSKDNARRSFCQIARVLKHGHTAWLQMPNRYGVRQAYHYWKRGFTDGDGFEIRYWTPAELLHTFRHTFGPTRMTVDGFFGLGIQAGDIDLLPLRHRAVVYGSEVLRAMSRRLPVLIRVADSVYLEAVNAKTRVTQSPPWP